MGLERVFGGNDGGGEIVGGGGCCWKCVRLSVLILVDL